MLFAPSLLVLVAFQGGGDATPEVGQAFPLQAFPQIGAEGLHSLAEYRGRKVLLVQFASW